MASLDAFLFSPVAKTSRGRRLFWLSICLTYTLIWGIVAAQEAFSLPYIVQDDARQHVFWMQRFLDPNLFPNDLIADYFQSVAPWGYTQLYRLFAGLGVDPLLLSKLLPLPLTLAATAYGFGVALQLLPIPLTGCLAGILVSQTIWAHEDVISASPRAFMPLIFLAFLYYLLRRRLLPCLVTIVLEGLFYPQYVFVFAGLLLCLPLRWRQGLRLSREQQDYWFSAAGLTVAFLVLLPFALSASAFGPTITAAEARELPEFYLGNRSSFFRDNPLIFWLTGFRSGIFPSFAPPIMALGILLPWLLWRPQWFPLATQVHRKVIILPQIAVVGLALFGLAHAVLFKLHLPSRYTSYTLRYALIFAAAITLTLLLEAGWRGWTRSSSLQRLGMATFTVALTGHLLLLPTYTTEFPDQNYRTGENPTLYDFFAQQPQDIRIASLLREADNLPTFSRRSVVVGREFAIPYHVGYANQFRQRAMDLIQAQYTRDPAELQRVIDTYQITFWLIEPEVFKPKFLRQEWVRQYPTATKPAIRNLNRGVPVLQQRAEGCTVFRAKNLSVVDAACLVTQAKPPAPGSTLR